MRVADWIFEPLEDPVAAPGDDDGLAEAVGDSPALLAPGLVDEPQAARARAMSAPPNPVAARVAVRRTAREVVTINMLPVLTESEFFKRLDAARSRVVAVSY
jgi:hypothetical protein